MSLFRMHTVTSRRWPRFPFVLVALLLVVIGAGTWWRFHGSSPPVPPMPPDIPDAEVRLAIQRAHHKVLDAPSDAKAWGHLGMILLAHQLYAEADRCFVEAAHLNPNSPNWPYGRALIALKLHPDDAPAFLRQTLSAAGHSWPEYQSAARLQLAEMYLERQELEEAEKLFQEEWRCRPDGPRAALGLGMIALARDDLRSAEDFLHKAQASSLARKRATVQLAVLGTGQGAASYAINFAPVQFGGKTLLTGMPGGTSNTVLFGERLAYCAYEAHGNETVSAWAEYYEWGSTNFSFSWDAPIFNGPNGGGTAVGGSTSFSYAANNAGYPGIRASVYQGAALQTGATVTTCDYSVLQSMHPGVVVCALGDGSVHPVSTAVSLTSWQYACINWNAWSPTGSTAGTPGSDF